MIKNVAIVEQGYSDEIKITLIGCAPLGIPQIHEFKGIGLRAIDAIFRSTGIDVVAWIVETLPWSNVDDLPLVLRAKEIKKKEIKMSRTITMTDREFELFKSNVLERKKMTREEAENIVLEVTDGNPLSAKKSIELWERMGFIKFDEPVKSFNNKFNDAMTKWRSQDYSYSTIIDIFAIEGLEIVEKRK